MREMCLQTPHADKTNLSPQADTLKTGARLCIRQGHQAPISEYGTGRHTGAAGGTGEMARTQNQVRHKACFLRTCCSFRKHRGPTLGDGFLSTAGSEAAALPSPYPPPGSLPHGPLPPLERAPTASGNGAGPGLTLVHCREIGQRRRGQGRDALAGRRLDCPRLHLLIPSPPPCHKEDSPLSQRVEECGNNPAKNSTVC